MWLLARSMEQVAFMSTMELSLFLGGIENIPHSFSVGFIFGHLFYIWTLVGELLSIHSMLITCPH